eukprot:scaffold196445_cov83-Cyclotella_meneghiniana.AAC.1
MKENSITGIPTLTTLSSFMQEQDFEEAAYSANKSDSSVKTKKESRQIPIPEARSRRTAARAVLGTNGRKSRARANIARNTSATINTQTILPASVFAMRRWWDERWRRRTNHGATRLQVLRILSQAMRIPTDVTRKNANLWSKNLNTRTTKSTNNFHFLNTSASRFGLIARIRIESLSLNDGTTASI